MTGELNVLHTYAKILTNLNDGDSLTAIFRKTRLSYVTVSKSVKELEKMGIIATEEELTRHGKARRCFILKPSIKEESYSFLREIKKYKTYLNGE